MTNPGRLPSSTMGESRRVTAGGPERHNRDAAAHEAAKWLIDQGYAPSLADLRALANECFPSRGTFDAYWQRIAARWIHAR